MTREDNDPSGPRISGWQVFFASLVVLTMMVLVAALIYKLVAAIIYKPMQRGLTTEAAPAVPAPPPPPPQWQFYYLGGTAGSNYVLVIETETGNRWLSADNHGTALVQIPNVPNQPVERR